MKQTAVEWLHEKLATSELKDMQTNINVWFKQAKEIEKEQIIHAWELEGDEYVRNGKDYYEVTFKK